MTRWYTPDTCRSCSFATHFSQVRPNCVGYSQTSLCKHEQASQYSVLSIEFCLAAHYVHWYVQCTYVHMLQLVWPAQPVTRNSYHTLLLPPCAPIDLPSFIEQSMSTSETTLEQRKQREKERMVIDETAVALHCLHIVPRSSLTLTSQCSTFTY